MNQVIIDNSLLAVSIFIAIIISIKTNERKVSVIFAALLLFPPLLVFLNMWAHTVAVSVLTIRKIQAGNFQYNFTVYSLFLFGIVFTLLSGYTIHYTKKFITGTKDSRPFLFLLYAATIICFAPVGFITPIGFLPVIVTVISTVTLAVHNPYKKLTDVETARSPAEHLLTNA